MLWSKPNHRCSRRNHHDYKKWQTEEQSNSATDIRSVHRAGDDAADCANPERRDHQSEEWQSTALPLGVRNADDHKCHHDQTRAE